MKKNAVRKSLYLFFTLFFLLISIKIISGCTGNTTVQVDDAHIEQAEDFIRKSATYRYDGENLLYKEAQQGECEKCVVLLFTFDSRHGGYGDREGQILTQVITPHRAKITLEDMNVIQAILDETWDMIGQKML